MNLIEKIRQNIMKLNSLPILFDFNLKCLFLLKFNETGAQKTPR